MRHCNLTDNMRDLSYHTQLACSSEYLHVMTSKRLISAGLSAADPCLSWHLMLISLKSI